MPVTVKRLGPNVYLHRHPETRYKSASISFHYVLPLDPKRASALNLLAKVLKNGCRRYPTMQHVAARLEALFGADIFHATQQRYTYYEVVFGADCLEDRYIIGNTSVWRELTDLCQALIYDPCLDENGFSQDAFRREKRNLLLDLDAQIESKENYALLRARETLVDNPLFRTTVTGTREEVESLTMQDLVDAYRHLLNDSVVHIYYSGSADEETVLSWCNPVLSHHQTPVTLPDPYYNVYPEQITPREVEETADAEQSHVVVAFVIPEWTGKYTIAERQLFKSILGTSANAKLFKSVREKSGLCYSCSLSSSSPAAVYFAEAGVQRGNEERTIAEIREQVRLMHLGEISNWEYRTALSGMKSTMYAIPSSPRQTKSFHLQQYLGDLPTDPIAWWGELAHVSREDVVRLSREVRYAGSFILRAREGKPNETV